MADHPSGRNIGLGRSKVWYGPEVEGPLKKTRAPTAFVNGPLNGSEMGQLRAKLEAGEVRHLFIAEDFVDWVWFEGTLMPLLVTYATPTKSLLRHPISIACRPDAARIRMLLAKPWAPRIQLVVRAREDADWLSALRPADQISVGQPYDLVTWTVGDGVRTQPDEYKDDTE